MVLLFLGTLGTVIAQGGPGGPGGDPEVPLDGGAILMLIAGVAYGVKRLRGKREK